MMLIFTFIECLSSEQQLLTALSPAVSAFNFSRYILFFLSIEYMISSHESPMSLYIVYIILYAFDIFHKYFFCY